MTDLKSWRLWVIVLLALTTLACAGRRERREEARELRRERMEERRAVRQEALERRRAERERSQDAAPVAQQQDPQQAEQAPQQQAEPRPQRQTRAQQRQQLREERQQQREERQQAGRKTQERETTAASFAPAPAAAADAASKLVFMRVSKQSTGMDAALFDVTEPGAPKYIGTVSSASKLTYPVNPGLYTFMAVGETAEFMQATIVGGKTYYALVIPRAGAKRFTIEPVRSNEIGTSEFNGWDRNTRASSGSQQAHNAADAAEKRTRYWQEWMNKSQSQRDELTLKAEDGR